MSMYTNFSGSLFPYFYFSSISQRSLKYCLECQLQLVSEIHLQHFARLYSKPSFMMPFTTNEMRVLQRQTENTVIESFPFKKGNNFTLACFYELLNKITSFISVRNGVCLDPDRYRLFCACSASSVIVLGIDVTWCREGSQACVSSLTKL